MFVSMLKATTYRGSRLVLGSVVDVPSDVGERWVARGIARVAERVEAPLPATFPGRAALNAAGITRASEVPRDASRLTAVNGIGAATARRILARLE